MSALRISYATIGYHHTAVLRDVSLHVPAGQTLVLTGANGSGKSTLIKAVLGLADVLAGSIDGPARREIGYVPQLDTLDADFPVSAGQVVLMGRYRRIGWWRPTGRADRRAAAEALDRVGLADRAGDRFGVLSGGQRQRVLLARAMAGEPRLLLLDEPFNGVDADSQVAILAVLRELAVAGTALVVSTHDLALAGEPADQVYRLGEP